MCILRLCSLELIQNYFSAIEQYFSLATFQHKYQHKPNFSINEQGYVTTLVYFAVTTLVFYGSNSLINRLAHIYT